MDDIRNEVLNVGLELAMEFGEDWLAPIQTRLGARFPALTSSELNAHDTLCRTTMGFGHRLVSEVLAEFGGFHELTAPTFCERMLAKYAWVSQDNLGRLYSQGCYYAMK